MPNLTPRIKNNPFISCSRPARLISPLPALRTIKGSISVEIRLAVALRLLAGAAYGDTAILFGLADTTIYQILWEVIDAINNTPEVGAFFFPEAEFDCRGHAARFKVRLSKYRNIL